MRSPTADLFCTQCRQSRPRAGGTYVKFNQGRNQRWRCADCTVRVALRVPTKEPLPK